MAAFPLPLTFDKRITPPPVGCQGNWALRAIAPTAPIAGIASFGRSLLMSWYTPGKVDGDFMRGMMVTAVSGGGDG